MKKILGLDLGTNSIGWALVEAEDKGNASKIIKMGSRIIPMDERAMSDFNSGSLKTQTAERTRLRGVRRLQERYLLRRERLHRVLNILGFLPNHYADCIDFEKHFGKFKENIEPKLVYKYNNSSSVFDFIFKKSFEEMVQDFKRSNATLFYNKSNGYETKIPYDWTLYYLRKKALTYKIEKEELAWLLLNFNQKRGYYQLRGEDDEEATKTAKTRKYFEKQVITDIIDTKLDYKGLKVLVVELANGNKGKIFKKEIPNWIGTEKNIIATVDIDKDGNDRFDDNGTLSQRFSIPTEAEWDTEWKLIKLKTERDLLESKKTVGSYIYDTLLQKPDQKINGKLVRTIERKFYKQELTAILACQREFHSELRSSDSYNLCLQELYEYNDSHRSNIEKKDFVHLFSEDIIFYQRPLKSKKSLISDCPFEKRVFEKNGENETKGIKCIAKSNPYYQEFRLWQFLQNLKLYQKEKLVNGKIETDVDVTVEFLKTEEDWVNLFDWLNERKSIEQSVLFSSYFKIKKAKGATETPYRWNYVESKEYPCNETRALFLKKLEDAKLGVETLVLMSKSILETNISRIKHKLTCPKDYKHQIELEKALKEAEHEYLIFNKIPALATRKAEEFLWHTLYSIEDKIAYESAIKKIAADYGFNEDFFTSFTKTPPLKKDYGSYSEKAIKKLLPLIRRGRYWSELIIHEQTKNRIDKIINGEFDDKIRTRVREKAIHISSINDCINLPLWLASYIVYNRHSEIGDIKYWKTTADIEDFLRNEYKQHSLRNPVVEQVITETLRVVTDIWRCYGDNQPDFFNEIHIELGREMKNPANIRKQLTSKISENENTNQRIKALLIEMLNDSEYEDIRPYSPNQQEILKIYEEGVLSQYTEVELKNEKFDDIDIFKITKTSSPTKKELEKYKLWLSQKYKSPYTGKVIPLSKLFTPAFQIEHIIPQSRYFDDSFTNKVICEAEVNTDKDNQTGYEYIKKNHGKIIELNLGGRVRICEIDEYETLVREMYANNRSKMKRLLMEDVPDDFINRQLNDSRYISKIVKTLLSNIVREKGEEEATSKNVLSSNGSITSTLKQDWGLNDVWNTIVTPRFERLNTITKSNAFGSWTNKDGNKVFQTEVPFELQKGFNKKRIDHRHHALDALIIACATRNHINYLNNESAKAHKKDTRYELKSLLCFKKYNGDSNNNYKWVFKKPWDTFTQDSLNQLQTSIVSFKQNLRVINKTVNYYQHWKVSESGKKEKVTERQVKGESWAIRKPIHKDTVSGTVQVRIKKSVSFLSGLKDWENLVDKNLKLIIKNLIRQSYDEKSIVQYFKKNPYTIDAKQVVSVELYAFTTNATASRVSLSETFTQKQLEKITDSGIKKILENHLLNYLDAKGDKQYELAFNADGIERLNTSIKELNGGKNHHPIYKVRLFEEGSKFCVGEKGSKKNKFVEAAQGTNLFFAVYWNPDSNKREYETIPLNEVIAHQKQNARMPKGDRTIVPIDKSKGQFLFSLSPDDLVYVPTEEEQEHPHLVDFKNITEDQAQRIYRMVSCTGKECQFIKAQISSLIKVYDAKTKIGEFGSLNKQEVTFDGSIRIKEICWKIKTNRLGNILLVLGNKNN